MKELPIVRPDLGIRARGLCCARLMAEGEGWWWWGSERDGCSRGTAERGSGGQSKLSDGEVAEAKSAEELTAWKVRTRRCGRSSGGAGRRDARGWQAVGGLMRRRWRRAAATRG
jgi:hypothetical protein